MQYFWIFQYFHPNKDAKPHSSVRNIADLRTGGRWFNPRLSQYSFPRIDDSHCDRIQTSLTTVRCFNNGELGKQPVALKEYCGEYWLKELQESMDRCTGCSNITEILLKMALNTIQSINQPNKNTFSLSSKSLRFRSKGRKFHHLVKIKRKQFCCVMPQDSVGQ